MIRKAMTPFLFFQFTIKFVLSFSIIWGFKTLILLHLKTISTEKGFLPFTAKITIVFWATMAISRRILSMVAFFISSLGLFNILYHWEAEKIPFRIRQLDYMRDHMRGPNDILELYNMTEKVMWSDIDRWNYDDPYTPTAPHYTIYTGLTLGQTFISFIGLFVLHFLAILVVKSFTIEHFWLKGHYNKFVHILTNMNIATPWRDWDQDKCSVEQHKVKHRKVNIEMAVMMMLNFFISLLMILPLFYTGKCYC